MRRRPATAYLLLQPKNGSHSNHMRSVPATGLKKVLLVIGASVGTIGFLVVLSYTLVVDSGLIFFGYRKGIEVLGVFFVIAFPTIVVWGERDKKRRKKTNDT
jgi:hypothetical protein